MSFRVVENVINAFSKNRRYLTRERLLALAGLASHLLSLASVKRPFLAPFKEAFTSLTKDDAPGETASATSDTTHTRITQQIHILREKVLTATKTEKVKLRAQIDALVDLL